MKPIVNKLSLLSLALSLTVLSLPITKAMAIDLTDRSTRSYWLSKNKKSSFRQNTPAYNRKIPRVRNIFGIQVFRPFGKSYLGYGGATSDNQAMRWLAFTAITITLLNHLSEAQQRQHEEAQIKATTAAKNETIHWEDGDASGSVKTTRIGVSTSGRHCREFQQTINIGNKTEQAYGTACLQPDGVWEIIK